MIFMKKIPLVLLSIWILVGGCNVAQLQSLLDSNQLTEAEVIEGLKKALDIGTSAAVNTLSDPGGYLMDETVKILLPPAATDAISKLRSAPGGESIYKSLIENTVEDLVKAINSSAEDAAKEAAPIFKNAITSMSIQDGWSILKGDYQGAGDISATTYFKDRTYSDLSRLFEPKINQSLNKPLVNNLSANKIWDTFVTNYNKTAKSPANLLLKLEPVKETNLAQYVTARGLDGLFNKVSVEEKKIRDDPFKYSSDIIKRVFGNNRSGI